MVSNLDSQNAFISFRRISNDIGKVAIQRNENRTQLLRFRNNEPIRRIDRNVILQTKNFVTSFAKTSDY